MSGYKFTINSLLSKGETSYKDICDRVGIEKPDLYTLSTPILKSGAYKKEKTKYQRSIYACAILSPKDTCEFLAHSIFKCCTLSMNGAGLSVFMGHVRPLGSKITNGKNSSGIIPFIHLIDLAIKTFFQSSVRKGAGIAWLPIHHPDIRDFLLLGDSDKVDYTLHQLKLGVVLTKKFMECVETNTLFPLELPEEYGKLHGDSEKPKYVSAKDLLTLIVKKRFSKGYPYIMFDDNVNEKRKGDVVECSNLCSEVLLPPHPEKRLALCCLGVINSLELYNKGLKGDKLELFITNLISEVDSKLTYYRLNDKENSGIYDTKTLDVGVGLSGLCDVANTIIIEEFINISRDFEGEHNLMLVIPTIIKTLIECDFFVRLTKAIKEYSERFPDTYKFVIAPNTTTSRILGGISSGIMPHRSKKYSFVVDNKPEEVTCKIYSKYLLEISKLKREHRLFLDKILLYQENLVLSEFNPEYPVVEVNKITPKFTGACHILNNLLFEFVGVIDQGISFSLFSPKKKIDIENEMDKIKYYHSKGVKTLYYHTTLDSIKADTCNISDLEGCSSCEN